MFVEEAPTGSQHSASFADEPATSTAEAVRACRLLAERINASGFGLYFIAAQGETRRLAPVFDSEFPSLSSLSRAISVREAEGFARDAADATAPLWWRCPHSAPALCALARGWASEVAPPLGEIAGIAFPVSGERGRVGLFVFTGNDIVLDEATLCEVHARCFSLFGEVVQQRRQVGAATPPVSKREIECLRLTANGHTSDDIAGVLGLSVHTANQYLSNTTQKLNAVNRIHAVAKALRTGLID